MRELSEHEIELAVESVLRANAVLAIGSVAARTISRMNDCDEKDTLMCDIPHFMEAARDQLACAMGTLADMEAGYTFYRREKKPK